MIDEQERRKLTGRGTHEKRQKEKRRTNREARTRRHGQERANGGWGEGSRRRTRRAGSESRRMAASDGCFVYAVGSASIVVLALCSAIDPAWTRASNSTADDSSSP